MLHIYVVACYYRCARISCLQCNHVFLKPDSFGSVLVEPQLVEWNSKTVRKFSDLCSVRPFPYELLNIELIVACILILENLTRCAQDIRTYIWTYFIVNLLELDFVDSALDLLSFETWNVYGIKIQCNIRGVRVFDFGPQHCHSQRGLFSATFTVIFLSLL